MSRAQASETRSLQTINKQNVTLKHLQEQNYVALQRKMSIAMKGKLPAMPTAPKPVGKEKQPVREEKKWKNQGMFPENPERSL